MKLLVPSLLALTLVAPLSVAQQDQGPAAAQPTPKATPAGGDTGIPPALRIPDISAHRVDELPYVRRMADIVPLELPPYDIEAPVLFVIDKQPVTREEFRQRALMYMGTGEIDQQVTRLITLQEIEHRVADEGADRAAYMPSEADIDKKIEDLKELVAMQARNAAQAPDGGAAEGDAVGPAAPENDPGEQAVAEFLLSIDASVGMPKYRQMLGAESAFEKVFLPTPEEATEDEVWDLANGPVPDDDPKPEWMPQITWDALAVDESGRNLRQFVKTSAASGDEIPSFFSGQILTRIRSGVIGKLGVDYFFDVDLPPGVFLRIGSHRVSEAEQALQVAQNSLADGIGDQAAVDVAQAELTAAREQVTDVTTDELWYLVKDQVADADLDLILRELLTLRGMRRVLEAAGRWPTPEETRQAFRDHEQEYAGTLFPLTAIIMFRGYDSLDRYREHFRYRHAYRAWREETMSDEELEEHYRAGGRLFFERGSIVVDAAYKGVSSLPFQNSSFDSAESALVSAFGGLGQMVGEGEGAHPASFLDIAADFLKPIIRQTQGDDRTFQRNQLRMRLTESELSIFLSGYSLADDMFYHGLPGEVFGPCRQRCRRHAWGAELNAGVWMAQVVGYARGRALAPMEGTNYVQAKDDYLDLNYLFWSQECLKTLLPRVKSAES